MGIDAEIYVEGVATPEQMARATEMLIEICPEPEWFERDGRKARAPIIEKDWGYGPRIEINTLQRYWGPGYERGDWPTLYTMIRIMGVVFERPVFYGGDTSDWGIECTPEFLEEQWKHQLCPDYNRYHERSRGYNALNGKPKETP